MPDDQDPDLSELIERLAAVLAGEARQHWDHLGLHPVHGRILVYLANANRYSDTLTAVVDYLGATKGTVSQSLERLVERGLIERSPDGTDLRVSHLRLTAEGRKILRQGHPPPAWAEAMVDENHGLKTGLTSMLARLQQSTGRRSFGACRTCRHHLIEGEGRFRCGLTQEPLTTADRDRWCREHALAEPAENI